MQTMDAQQPVGLTRDAGFEMGIRRTLNVSPDEVWRFMFSERGRQIWLGDVVAGAFLPDSSWVTADGISGQLRVLKPDSHFRMTWQARQWANVSTLQVRVIPNKGRTTLSFHQEKLADAAQREMMLAHWERVLLQLAEALLPKQA